MDVKLNKQVLAVTSNKTGEFASVTGALAEAGINLTGLCAWGENEKAYFALLTQNNAKAMEALKKKGIEVSEEAVVTILLDDKAGSAAAIALKLKNAGVSLDYVYGTSCGCRETEAMLILKSKDNAKILAALNE
ncbi:MAG: hypothetical protein WC732_03540 [Candidatus Omnitrophota bacterium]